MYSIFELAPGSAQLLEQLGTKYKFWFRMNGRRYLFKEGRINTGEDWAEKVVDELCRLLNIPSAAYDFATYMGRYGVITESIVPENGRLILGNELISRLEKEYDASKTYHHSGYTISRVFAVLRKRGIGTPYNWIPPEGITSAPDVFVGYLMLDALVGNQDRHHENWGLVVLPSGDVHLAHTFDHASSLGRNESEEKMKRILSTKDKRSHISAYIKRAKSAFFSSHTADVRLKTIEAFQESQRYHPDAARLWLQALERVKKSDVDTILNSIPDVYMSSTAKQFAGTMIQLNQQRLLDLVEARK